MTDVLIDGLPASNVPVTDRGLLFGDGLFETLAFWRGECPLWSLHWARLSRGCEALGLDCPDESGTRSDCERLIAGHEYSVVRITVTRGSGGRAYWPDPAAPPRRIVARRDWPSAQRPQQEDGLHAVRSTIRLSIQPRLSGLKHANRLEQVLAARECLGAAADEAVLFDRDGHLAEAIASNLLLRIEGSWVYPESPASVAGVGLAWMISNPPFPIAPRVLSGDDLAQADSIVVINSVSGIRPLRTLDGTALIIDRDCRRMQDHWNRHLIPPCDD
jgi:4-amino-4-deoxychorismate lyase